MLVAIGLFSVKILLPWLQKIIDETRALLQRVIEDNRKESKEQLEYSRNELARLNTEFLTALERRDKQLRTMSNDFIDRLDRIDRLSHQRATKRTTK